jgi:hypothetical protein
MARIFRRLLAAIIVLLVLLVLALLALNLYSSRLASVSADYIVAWFTDLGARPALTNVRTPCPGAPFLLPSAGLIGLLWDDPTAPYNIVNPHTGLDIFGDGAPGSIPVYAAYDGYLSRFADWVSTVIIRHDDPLVPGRTIWTYYTHMAARDGGQSFVSADFPPGTSERWVTRGTLLGYQGEYSPNQPIGLHLHISIVQSASEGGFRNEARISNTLDPSPYFGMALSSGARPARPIPCT